MSDNNVISSLITALQSLVGTAPDVEVATPTPVTPAQGFETITVADNGLNTIMYLRSEGQTIPAELVGQITYGELVSKYFDVAETYTVTVTRGESSETVTSSDIYGTGVSVIIVTEQTASLG